MNWEDDALFATKPNEPEFPGFSPAFRFSGVFPYETAHPYLIQPAWQALFECFAPLLREHCDRIRMWDRPGAKARRQTKIQPADWAPFASLRREGNGIEEGIFTGFYFVDRRDEGDMDGSGPCAFRFFVGSAIRVDACIPVADWRDGRLDIGQVIQAAQNLPYASLMAGFGLCLSDQYARGDDGDMHGRLLPVAKRYPALDLVHATDRSTLVDQNQGVEQLGLAGINWLTGVGEPLLHRMDGRKELLHGLPPEVAVFSGTHGAIFRLGTEPISGAVHTDDRTLPLYHWLGKHLQLAHHPGVRTGPVFGDRFEKESAAWERRFY